MRNVKGSGGTMLENTRLLYVQWEQQLITFSQLLNFENVSNIALLNKVTFN